MTITPRPVLLASGNAHKIRELSAMLAPYDIAVVSPEDLHLEMEVEETGETFAENAVLKAEAYARAAGLPSVADDSGICVVALGGEPGVRSARFGGPGLDDAGRTALLLERMRGVPEEQRAAAFVCCIAVAVPGGPTETFERRVEGTITREPRGGAGFGYDPVFWYPPFGATFGEVEPERKAAVSHRGQALGAALPSILRATGAGILEDRGTRTT